MKEIIIYSTPSCPYCVMAKRYFDDIKVKYRDIDVSSSQEDAKVMQDKSGQLGVPVIIMPLRDRKEEVIIGFDKDKIDNVLKTTK